MKELINEFEAAIAEVEPLCAAALCSEGLLEADTETVVMVQKVFKLVNVAKKLSIEQARTIDSMNEKLDLLLAMIEIRALAWVKTQALSFFI